MPPEGGKVDASKPSEATREVRVTRGCFFFPWSLCVEMSRGTPRQSGKGWKGM